MSVAVIFVLAVILFMLVLLVVTPLGPDTVLMGGLTLFLVSGIISPAEALSGTDLIIHRILGRPRSIADGQLKLMAPVAALSAFLNNTPVVAVMIPAVLNWSRRFSLQVSRLLIPLSYASMLGGTCTLIGTSTNLVVAGLVRSNTNLEPIGFFDIAWIGVPCTIVGLLFVVLFSKWLLPERTLPISCWENPREYTVEMVVEPDGPLVDKSVEEAGLRHLPGMFLAEIERGGQLLAAVAPQEPLEPNDRLVFAGLVDAVVDLQKIRGLKPATKELVKLDSRRSDRILVEAVVSNRSSLVGKSVREGAFRSRYNAVVIAAARHGERLKSNIGDVVIRPGDTLLLEAEPSFVEEQRHSFDFFLISPIEDSVPPRHERAFVAMAILGALVLIVSMRWLSILQAAMVAGGAMIITGCVNGTQARRSVDWQVLLTIAASFGIGQALVNTGGAGLIANSLIELAGGDPLVTLAVVYLLTAVFTSLITNNAAVVLLFPIAITAANDLQVNLLPFVMTIMVGASASFATPIGYQTNLMVYTAGGYRFADFLRIGLPLNVAIGVVTVLLVPLIWGF
jgi:di/tricarboxylate transporter